MEGFQKGDIISQYGNGHLQTSSSIAKYHNMSYDSWDGYKYSYLSLLPRLVHTSGY